MDWAGELAMFLRSRRERLDPAEMSLAVRHRRRALGLRREEVAELAGLSVDYVVRLEQGRGVRPSPAALEALARTLRLTDDERAHLFDLAGHRLPTRRRPHEESVLIRADRVVQALSPTPAWLINHRLDVLASNPECTALHLDLGGLPPGERNLWRMALLHPDFREFFLEREVVLREWTAHLRTMVAEWPDDQELAGLVEDLLHGSEEFARCWALGEVGHYRGGRRAYRHPRYGPVSVESQVLVPLGLDDHRIIVYLARDAAAQKALDAIARDIRRG